MRGQADSPFSPELTLDMNLIVDDATSLLDNIKPLRPILVGLSIGGLFAARNCAQIMDVRPGSMGKAIPGHIVEIVDDSGNVLPPETPGNVAIRRPDPVMFLEYWKNPEATENKFIGDWSLTGDMGRKDEDGYLWFVGREDDLITSSGYRIGPGEIEDCLIKHPAVSMAAVDRKSVV